MDRAEEFMGLPDVRKRFIKNKSEQEQWKTLFLFNWIDDLICSRFVWLKNTFYNKGKILWNFILLRFFLLKKGVNNIHLNQCTSISGYYSVDNFKYFGFQFSSKSQSNLFHKSYTKYDTKSVVFGFVFNRVKSLFIDK